METLTLQITNSSKKDFLLELLNQFDFIILPENKENQKKSKQKKHDFFASAGIWKDSDISQESLRNKAWKR